MIDTTRLARSRVFLGIATALMTVAPYARAAPTGPVFTTLASFEGQNGLVALSGLTFDLEDNLYGTTAFGGPGYQAGGAAGQGIVFALSGSAYTMLKTVVAFDGTNGTMPTATLTPDAFGNLYGTTASGGTAGMGTVFELSGAGHRHLTTLMSFAGQNGARPLGGLTLSAPAGASVIASPFAPDSLFGTTSAGGVNGDGTVFRLSGPNHKTLTTVVTFSTAVNGARPGATMVADAAGHLFGTTFTGGGPGDAGTVFELSGPNHATLTTLAVFNGSNGANPQGGLTLDAAGNLYGTTSGGGPGYGGTIFELAGPNHTTLTTLASFGSNDPDGAVPQGALLVDAAGNLYGTTNGGADEFGDGAYLGAVFKLSADHTTMTPLHTFTGGNDGDIPQAGLTVDAAGNLYGTTTSGGAGGDLGGGTVFEISGAGFVTRLGSTSSRN